MNTFFQKAIPLSLVGIAVLLGTGWADPSPSISTRALTWQDCVRVAAQHNPDLLASLLTTKASRALYLESINGILPHVSLTHSYNDSSVSGGGDIKSWQAQGNASLNLIDFAQFASIESASAALKLSQANREITGNNTLLSLYRAFTALMYAQDEIGVTTSIRDTWKMNSQMISLRYKSGSESKGNDMNTQAQLLQAEIGLSQAGRDIVVAQQQLSQVLGLGQFTALQATGTWTPSSAPPLTPDFEAIVNRLPQIRAQQAVLDQARAALKSAHSTLWPSLSVNYSKGLVGRTEFPSNPFWNFTGVLSYPIFGNGLTSTYYASQAAQRSYEKALQDLRSLRNQNLTNLRSAWSGFAQAEDQIRVQRAFLEADRQRKAEYDVLYRSGLMSFQEWILVVNEYVNFQTSFLRSEQNRILAEAQWRFAQGEVLGE